MGKAFYLQNNMTGGQLTPRLGLRTDFVRYRNGLAALENQVVMPQGGTTSRTGFVFAGRTKHNDKESALIPFEVSADIAFQIEAGEFYFRFYDRDGNQIRLTGQDITGVTQANPAVVTYSGSDTYSNGDRVVISNTIGMTELNNREFTVANVDAGANTFELSGVDSSGYTAYASGGFVEEVYEVSHPYSESEVSELRFCQSADVLFLHHGDHAPRRLSRTSDTSWTLSIDTQIDGPYFEENKDDITLTLSATSGTVTVTSSAALFEATDTSGTGGTGSSDRLIRIQDRDKPLAITGVTKADPAVVSFSTSAGAFSDGDIVYISGVVGMTELNGKSFEVENVGSNNLELKDIDSTGYTTYSSGGTLQKKRDEWRWLKITGYTSSTVVTAELQDDGILGSTGPLSSFRLGAWSDTTGYPVFGTFFENRLVRFRTDTQKSKFWASALDNYVGYAPGVEDDDAYDFTLASNKLDHIQWVASQRQLRVGTTGSEYSISGGQGSITPTNINVKRETENGSPFVDAIPVRNSTLFLQRAGRKLREFTYNFDIDGFVDPDLSIGAEDIPRPGIEQMVHQMEPDGVVWARKSDGSLVGLTYLRDQDVVGWHTHPLGGTNTKVEALSVTPTATQDRVWVVISRTIDGTTVRSVEYLGDQFVDKTIKDAIFLDSAFSYTGDTPDTTLTPAAISGNSVVFTAGSSVFTSDDIGREIRSGSGKAIITAQSGTTATANIVSDFSSTGVIASGDWTLSTSIVTGVSHLEGETVSILADGGVHPTAVVTNGRVSLDGQYTTVHIGIPYTQRVLSLNIEGGSELGTAQGSRGRVTTVILRFLETVGARLRATNGPSQTIDFRRPSDLQDEGVPLFTGEKEIKPSRGFADKIEIEITQDQPLPLTLLGYVAKIEVSNAP